MKLTYKVGGSKKTQENYTFPIGAPASISKNRLGLVTISEKNGGMNGIYSVTYLYPGDDGFITFGTAELSMDNGKYTEINRISPEWIKRASANDRTLFIRSIVSHSDIFIDSGQNQSLDDAMFFFALPELMREIQKSDSTFLVNYSNRLSKDVNSSMANLIRRRFLGNQVN
ncbi:hypothetical protein P0D69_03650 [Paraburkholderia sediminicola]|uniref:hypothetical protein n=1 Tax=Paraburkholderia sediminicola TaxID=458836 RepID=UPI0038BA4B4A